jgi:hypothetical protein
MRRPKGVRGVVTVFDSRGHENGSGPTPIAALRAVAADEPPSIDGSVDPRRTEKRR